MVFVSSEMNEQGTVFGDGIEADRLDFSWGMRLTVGIAPNRVEPHRRLTDSSGMTTRRPTGRSEANDEEARFFAAYDPNDYERLLGRGRRGAHFGLRQAPLYSACSGGASTPTRTGGPCPGGSGRPKESLGGRGRAPARGQGGLTGPFLEQLYTFGAPERDPRTRVVSIAYYALVEQKRFVGIGDRNPDVITPRLQIPWEGETGGPVEALAGDGRPLPLAFDHAEMLGTAVKRLRGKLDYAPIGFELLGDTFTLLDLQRVHEAVLGRSVNKDSFRRRMLGTGLLKATVMSQSGVLHRPAELYRFARRSKE